MKENDTPNTCIGNSVVEVNEASLEPTQEKSAQLKLIEQLRAAYDKSPLHKLAKEIGGTVVPSKEEAYKMIEHGNYWHNRTHLSICMTEEPKTEYCVFYKDGLFYTHGGHLWKAYRGRKQIQSVKRLIQNDYLQVQEWFLRECLHLQNKQDRTKALSQQFGMVESTYIGTETDYGNFVVKTPSTMLQFTFDFTKSQIEHVQMNAVSHETFKRILAILREEQQPIPPDNT